MISTALLAVSAGLKIAGVVSDHVAQEKQSDSLQRDAMGALRLKRRDLAIRGVEEMQRAEQGRVLGERQATAASGTARASAAAAGVRGRSADAILGNIQGDLGRYYQSIDSNLVVTLDQLERYRQGAEAEAQARINSAPKPDLTSTLLRVGGVGVDAFTQWKDMQAPAAADFKRGLRSMEPTALPAPTSPFEKGGSHYGG